MRGVDSGAFEEGLDLGRVALDEVAEDLIGLGEKPGVQDDAGGGRVVLELLGTGGSDDGGGDVRVLQDLGHSERGH